MWFAKPADLCEFDDCVKRSTLKSKECMHVMYPNHPQLTRRKPCSSVLLKKVKTKKVTFYVPKWFIHINHWNHLSSDLLISRDLLKIVKSGEVEQYLVVICVTFTMAPYGANLIHQKETISLNLLTATCWHLTWTGFSHSWSHLLDCTKPTSKSVL